MNEKIVIYRSLIITFFLYLFYSYTVLGQTSLEVSPENTTVTTFQTITLEVAVNNITDLLGASVTMQFDETILQFSSIAQGDFLGSDGELVHFESLLAPGLITIDQARLATSGMDGSGVLFSVDFLLIAPGTSFIDFPNVFFRDSNNQPIVITQFVTGEVTLVPVLVNTKIFLEGPFNGGSMNTTLNNDSHLPLNQPYSAPPWNYSGSESVASGFFTTHTDIVDWILLEIRSDASSGTMVARKAAFVNNAGSITDLDGTSAVGFFIDIENYYVVVHHRNHLPIMSSIKIPLQINSSLYDFTLSQSSAYGANPMAPLSGGVFGLWSGDANSDREINALDRNETWNTRNSIGYLLGDVNLDTEVNALDRNITWNNRNLVSQVP